jgi:hypothetical protein
MFSVVDARALSRAAASDIPEWYITKTDTGGELSGMARTLRFDVAEPDASMWVSRISHQYQNWARTHYLSQTTLGRSVSTL